MNECELRDLLNDLNNTDYPSDEMSRLVITRLAWRGIRHRPMLGRVQWQGRSLTPHFWVEVDDLVLDFTAKRDLQADNSLPAGVVPKALVSAFYEGQQIVIDPLPDYLYEQVFEAPVSDKAA